MGYPEHPENILVKNKYYPNGLKEKDTWEYYQKVKELILKEVWNVDLMFFIATDINKTIVKRKGKETKFIRLTRSNYDDEVHGRVLSIHKTMRRYEDFCIVDIDTDDFEMGKRATVDTYNVLKDFEPIKDLRIRFTGKTSFHIYCNLHNKTDVNISRVALRAFLMNSDLRYNYSISETRKSSKVNIDLSPNKYRGGFIALHSLSVLGLKCMEVPLNKLSSFDANNARI